MKHIFAIALTALSAPAMAQNVEVNQSGKDSFVTHCATCHGLEGRGDGPMVDVISEVIPDLTQLSERNDGAFPMNVILRTIDGRIPMEGHGGPMPIFGSLFSEDFAEQYAPYVGEEIVRGRILSLAYYLEAIQD